MIKRIVPPISNEIITLVKDTSLARVIAIAGGHLDGRVLYEGQLQHCGPDLAPVLHRLSTI